VFYFILPIYKTTRQVKKGFQEMQDRMNQQQQQGSAPHSNEKVSSNKTGGSQVGEYIDFEEVK
jgi:hypothetical protein